jgi:hypothetical protein
MNYFYILYSKELNQYYIGHTWASLYQMFQNLVQNNRKPLQPPADSLTHLMNEMREEARFHINQMTACSFVGSTQTVTTELKEFIRFSRVNELMISSPIYEHQEN